MDSQGSYLPAEAVEAATALVGAVQDYDKNAVTEIVSRTDELPAIAVALAAMVPADRSVRELLAWNDEIDEIVRGRRSASLLKPHGTHAAFVRHRNAGTEPCWDCWEGERAYQRNRKRRAREAVAS